jgi:hypothetical protein
MVRHHKKTKKHSRRRRMRGGVWYDPRSWGKPATPAAAELELPPVVDKAASDVSSGVTDATKTVADGVGVPSASSQAAAVGAPAGSAGILGSDASLAAAGGRRRRRTRKHRKSHRKH